MTNHPQMGAPSKIKPGAKLKLARMTYLPGIIKSMSSLMRALNYSSEANEQVCKYLAKQLGPPCKSLPRHLETTAQCIISSDLPTDTFPEIVSDGELAMKGKVSTVPVQDYSSSDISPHFPPE